MSREWFLSGCDCTACMGSAEAYLSDAITRKVFTGFSSPLASMATTAARPAAFTLLLRIQVSELPHITTKQGQVVGQE